MNFLRRMLDGYRVDVVMGLYQHRGAGKALEQCDALAQSNQEPRSLELFFLLRLFRMKSLLELGRFEEAEALAKQVLEEGLSQVEATDDREFLHLLFEIDFCSVREAPDWMKRQAKGHSWDQSKLSRPLKSRMKINVLSEMGRQI